MGFVQKTPQSLWPHCDWETGQAQFTAATSTQTSAHSLQDIITAIVHCIHSWVSLALNHLDVFAILYVILTTV